MSEPLADFQCYVAKYEIRPLAWVEGMEDLEPEPSNMPQLVKIGPGKLLKPKPEAVSYAVLLLLQTKMPKWRAAQVERNVDLRTRFGPQRAPESESAYRAAASEPIEMDAEEFLKLKLNVLKIARDIGMLHFDIRMLHVGIAPPDGWQESLLYWIELASWVQTIFQTDDEEYEQLGPRAVGNLQILLAPGSVQVVPATTNDALIYRAAEMVAHGTTARKCDKCGTPFLEGGERANGNKKRAGSRFCSDKCRYEYHNEARRKAKATKS